MINAQAEHPPSDDGKDESSNPAEPEAVRTKEPEPWTPARVSEWNSYYDLYVAAGVLLLAFLSSANRIQPDNSVLWSWLHAGRQMAETGRPVVVDTTTIAGEGHRWVNIPWLFEWSHYQLFSIVAGLAPTDPNDEVASKVGRGEQAGIGALIALTALARALTAFLLLGLRRRGPGLWWTATCAALALGVFIVPVEIVSFDPGVEGGTIRTLRTVAVQLGGLARPAAVAPTTWGVLLFAGELLILHRAFASDKVRGLFALIPLFLVWANLDDSYDFGLVVLAAVVLGSGLDARTEAPSSRFRTGLIALAASGAATLVSPSHGFGLLASFDAVLSKLSELSKVGPDLGPQAPTLLSLGNAPGALIYFGLLFTIGLLSFAVNRRNFRFGRLLGFLAATLMWGVALSNLPLFAVAFAAVLATNGQEWYLDTFGSEGKLGTGWRAWSTGGRLVTIAVLFAAIAQGLTGWGGQVGEAVYGFGFDPDDFPFEVATALKEAPIQGGVLNTTLAQGDILAWRAAPKRKAYIDGRPHLYSLADFKRWEDLRRAIRDDDIDRWRPALAKGGISAILVQAANAPKTYERLMTSRNWVPFYDDGTVQMFGRADDQAPAADVAYFRANRLDAEELAYKRPQMVPALQRTPTATSELDEIFQNRLLSRPQPHVEVALHWLSPVGLDPSKPFLPDPARCLLAAREARIALVSKPDDPLAFQRLIDAYQLLLLQESALIAGIPLTPENIPKILQAPQQPRLLATRSRQLLAAMNYAIQTLPPPRNANDRRTRTRLNMGLSQLYLQMGVLDLARERLLAIDLGHPDELGEADFKLLNQQIGELNQRIDQIQAQLNELVIQQRASPQDKAAFARSQGALGMAIRELEEAADAGANPASIRPALVDLYCETGQPDKALDKLGNVDDPALSTGIGTATYRQGRVYFLLGNYANAVELWMNRSIPPLRSQRSIQATSTTQMLLSGEPMAATRSLLEIPDKVGLQAEWEFELALAALEGGLPPEIAAEHFETALKLEPDLVIRPVIAYYLEKLGKPVPPPRAATSPAPGPPEASPTPATPPTDKAPDITPAPATTTPASPPAP